MLFKKILKILEINYQNKKIKIKYFELKTYAILKGKKINIYEKKNVIKSFKIRIHLYKLKF